MSEAPNLATINTFEMIVTALEQQSKLISTVVDSMKVLEDRLSAIEETCREAADSAADAAREK